MSIDDEILVYRAEIIANKTLDTSGGLDEFYDEYKIGDK